MKEAEKLFDKIEYLDKMKENLEISRARYRAMNQIYQRKKNQPILAREHMEKLLRFHAGFVKLEPGDLFAKYMLPRIAEDIKSCETQIEKTL